MPIRIAGLTSPVESGQIKGDGTLFELLPRMDGTFTKPCLNCGSPPDPGSPLGLCTRCLTERLLDPEETHSHDHPVSRSGSSTGLKKIASGGMGAILEVNDAVFERKLAMKLMHQTDRQAGTSMERFHREARILAQLEHPNIVPVHDMGVNEEGLPYYTMKLVRGQNLADIIRKIMEGDASTIEQYPLTNLLGILLKICDAVGFAHSKGVIHRDLKPANIMVGEFGEVLLMDWGVAKFMTEDEVPESGLNISSSSPDLTHEGTVLGTPHFMSPEQARGELQSVNERSDIYSLGAILYQILTLRPPVQGSSVEEILEKIQTGSFEPPSSPDLQWIPSSEPDSGVPQKTVSLPHCPSGRVPSGLAAIAMKALSGSPADRYASAGDLAADIRSHRSGYATSAESIGSLGLLWMMIKRHRAASLSLAVLFLVSTIFMLKLIESERRANENATSAADQATRSKKAELRAVWESEKRLAALAEANLARASDDILGFRNHDALENLRKIPENLRGQEWHYLMRQVDSSMATISVPPKAGQLRHIVAVPDEEGAFYHITHWGLLGMTKIGETTRRERKTGILGANRLAVSLDGQTIAVSSSRDGRIHFLDAGSFKTQSVLETRSDANIEIAFAASGELVVLPKDSNIIQLWDPATQTRRLTLEPERVEWIAVTRKGDRLINAATDVSVYSLSDGKLISRHRRDSGLLAMSSFAVGPAGRRIALCDFRGRVVVESIFERGKRPAPPQRRLSVGNGSISSISFTPNGRQLIALNRGMRSHDGRYSPTVHIVDIATGNITRSFLGATWDSSGLTLDSSGRFFAVNGLEGGKIWKGVPAPQDQQWRFIGSDHGVSFSTTGREILAHTPSGRDLSIARIHSRGKVVHDPFIQDVRSPIIEASHDRKLFAIKPDHKICRVDVFEWQGDHPKKKVSITFDHPPRSLRLSPDNQHLVVVPSPSTAMAVVYALSSQKPVDHSHSEEIQSVNDANFVSNSRLMIQFNHSRQPSSMRGEWVGLWDFETSRLIKARQHNFTINRSSLSPDGKVLATACSDKKVRLFEADTLEPVATVRTHDLDVISVEWSPDGKELATSSLDLTIRFWDAETMRMNREFNNLPRPAHHLGYSPPGDRFAAICRNNYVTIWKLEAESSAKGEKAFSYSR